MRECKAQRRLRRFDTFEDLLFRVLAPCEVDPIVKWDMYTLLILCIKLTTNENLLYSTGNSTQCHVVT